MFLRLHNIIIIIIIEYTLAYFLIRNGCRLQFSNFKEHVCAASDRLVDRDHRLLLEL